MVTEAHQKAYRDLIADYAEQEPNHGWHDVTDVPTLTDADQALAISANPDILNEIELDAANLASILANGEDASPFRTHWSLGSYVSFRIAIAVRKWVLSDLQEEASRRNERRYERETQDYYGSARCMTTPELIARDCGVGRLFK